MLRKSLKTAVVPALTVLLGSGCQSTNQSTTAITPDYDTVTGLLARLSQDADGDGKMDTWAVMNGAVIVRIEVDEDANGTIDRWEYYTQPPKGDVRPSSNAIQKIDRSTKRDGHVNRWEYFVDGQLNRVDEDTNGDGKLDKWETYINGILSVMAVDTVGRGTPDRRLVYNSDGSFARVETDPDGIGHFEVVTQ